MEQWGRTVCKHMSVVNTIMKLMRRRMKCSFPRPAVRTYAHRGDTENCNQIIDELIATHSS